MIDRSTVFSIGVAGIIMLAVFAGMLATVDKQQVQHEIEISRAYCYQAYGDPTIYNAMATGGHGGFHCEANAGENGGNPHLHQIPRRYLERAYAANQSGESISFDPAAVAKPCYLWGTWCMGLGPIYVTLGIVALTTIGVLGFRYVADNGGGD